MAKNKMKLILVELNEINFDLVDSYIDKGEELSCFKKLLQSGVVETSAEPEYVELEPWIQWPSVHTGMTYADHKIFRLGDVVNSAQPQFFEQVENAGYKVGAISPMNARNALSEPAYFIPDPWTKTPSDGSFFSEVLTSAVSQAVNDNAQSRLSLKTIFSLVLAFFVLVKPSKMPSMIAYALSALGKPWRKALFLDIFLHQIHMALYRKLSPDFSTVFLNAGAHIQHHYFFNSSVLEDSGLNNPDWYIKEQIDPVLEMLKCYDEILQDLDDLPNKELIVATGLSQKPYDRLKIYYRLKNHGEFLSGLGIDYVDLQPRMTRDFLIVCQNSVVASETEQKLGEIQVDDGLPLFGEIDNRGKELFVTLTYPNEVTESTTISVNGERLALKKHLAFVAVKNGMHQGKGFAYFSDGIRHYMPEPGSHVSKIHSSVLSIFGVVP